MMDSKHIDNFSKSECTAKDMGTLGFGDSDVKSLLLLNRVFRVWTDRTGQYLDIEPDLRHAPLIISESGCNANTKTVSTPREQDKLVLDGRRSPILKREDATIQICLYETFMLGPRQIGSCRNRETFGPENHRERRSVKILLSTMTRQCTVYIHTQLSSVPQS